MPTRRANNLLQERLALPYAVASTAATTAVKLWSVPAGRSFRLDRVFYNNPTGLAASDTNYFIITIKKGATVMATWSTKLTGGNGALVADTPVIFVPSATAADLTAAAADVLSISAVLTGVATLAAGTLVLEGRLV